MLLVYYGKGKGKTTAALGTALRALGRGWRVLIVQFMKGNTSGEFVFISELSRLFKNQISIVSLGGEGFVSLDDLGDYNASLSMALSYGFLTHIYPLMMRELRPKLVILDELGLAIHIGLVDESLALKVLRGFAGNQDRHAILTGRYAPKILRELADLVTEFREVKHYFRKGYVNIEGLDV